MSYEWIARIERVSKSTQTEIFAFENFYYKNIYILTAALGSPITPREVTHVILEPGCTKLRVTVPQYRRLFWTPRPQDRHGLWIVY